MRRPSPWSLHLIRAFKIDVYLHASWFLLPVLHWQFGSRLVDSYATHFLLYIALFTIVLLHEFGHALACRSVGGKANLIILWPLGGIAFVQPPPRPWPVLWSIAAGPLVNVALAPVLWGLHVYFGAEIVGGGVVGGELASFITLVMLINLTMLVFNLLPIYPLDGGQMLHAVLWMFIGRANSLRVCSVLGIVCGLGLAVWAAVTFSVILLLIAMFVVWQAASGLLLAWRLSKHERQAADELADAERRARDMADPTRPR